MIVRRRPERCRSDEEVAVTLDVDGVAAEVACGERRSDRGW